MRRLMTLGVLVVGLTTATFADPEQASPPATPLPPPQGRRVVTVSKPEQRGAEPAIALNPQSPSQLVGAYGGPFVVWSADGGHTFTQAEGTQPEGWKGGGDVSVAYDDEGAAYLSYLTSDVLGTASYWAHNAGRSGIWVRRSPDGGKTWEPTPAVVRVWPSPDNPAPQMVDMSRIWADMSPKSPHHGNLYVAWINWELDQSLILFSRSIDHGRTWSAPQRISTRAGLPRDDNGGLVAPIGVVGPDGTQYVIWNDLNSIVFTTSTDGGKTFAPSRSIVSVAPPYFGGATGIPGIVRVMGFPQIGLDWQHGTLYVTWSDFRNGDVDVFLSRSSDKGATWTPAQRIVGDPIHDGKDQFFQWLAVDQANGDIYVHFYDRRDDPANRKTGVTLLRSIDGAATFTGYTWSDAPFEAENVFLGDYSWLVAQGGKVYGIWVEATPPDPGATSAPGARPRNGSLVKIGLADFSGIR